MVLFLFRFYINGKKLITLIFYSDILKNIRIRMPRKTTEVFV